jgi:hypothetical protein
LTAVRGVALCSVGLAVLLLAACGGSSRLSQDAYRTKLAQIKQEAASAQASVAKGLQAKTLAELKGRLDAFAESTERIGDEVAKLNPPENADAANTELADGLHETARATREASKQITGLHTPREAITYLEQSPLNKKGARQVDEALSRLKQLGYTSGS